MSGDVGWLGPEEMHRWTPEQMAAMRAAFSGNRWAAFTDDELLALYVGIDNSERSGALISGGARLAIDIHAELAARAALRTEPA